MADPTTAPDAPDTTAAQERWSDTILQQNQDRADLLKNLIEADNTGETLRQATANEAQLVAEHANIAPRINALTAAEVEAHINADETLRENADVQRLLQELREATQNHVDAGGEKARVDAEVAGRKIVELCSLINAAGQADALPQVESEDAGLTEAVRKKEGIEAAVTALANKRQEIENTMAERDLLSDLRIDSNADVTTASQEAARDVQQIQELEARARRAQYPANPTVTIPTQGTSLDFSAADIDNQRRRLNGMDQALVNAGVDIDRATDPIGITLSKLQIPAGELQAVPDGFTEFHADMQQWCVNFGGPADEIPPLPNADDFVGPQDVVVGQTYWRGRDIVETQNALDSAALAAELQRFMEGAFKFARMMVNGREAQQLNVNLHDHMDQANRHRDARDKLQSGDRTAGDPNRRAGMDGLQTTIRDLKDEYQRMVQRAENDFGTGVGATALAISDDATTDPAADCHAVLVALEADIQRLTPTVEGGWEALFRNAVDIAELRKAMDAIGQGNPNDPAYVWFRDNVIQAVPAMTSYPSGSPGEAGIPPRQLLAALAQPAKGQHMAAMRDDLILRFLKPLTINPTKDALNDLRRIEVSRQADAESEVTRTGAEQGNALQALLAKMVEVSEAKSTADQSTAAEAKTDATKVEQTAQAALEEHFTGLGDSLEAELKADIEDLKSREAAARTALLKVQAAKMRAVAAVQMVAEAASATVNFGGREITVADLPLSASALAFSSAATSDNVARIMQVGDMPSTAAETGFQLEPRHRIAAREELKKIANAAKDAVDPAIMDTSDSLIHAIGIFLADEIRTMKADEQERIEEVVAITRQLRQVDRTLTDANVELGEVRGWVRRREGEVEDMNTLIQRFEAETRPEKLAADQKQIQDAKDAGKSELAKELANEQARHLKALLAGRLTSNVSARLKARAHGRYATLDETVQLQDPDVELAAGRREEAADLHERLEVLEAARARALDQLIRLKREKTHTQTAIRLAKGYERRLERIIPQRLQQHDHLVEDLDLSRITSELSPVEFAVRRTALLEARRRPALPGPTSSDPSTSTPPDPSEASAPGGVPDSSSPSSTGAASVVRNLRNGGGTDEATSNPDDDATDEDDDEPGTSDPGGDQIDPDRNDDGDSGSAPVERAPEAVEDPVAEIARLRAELAERNRQLQDSQESERRALELAELKGRAAAKSRKEDLRRKAPAPRRIHPTRP